jgi:ankyrin repeat protein
VDVNARDAVGRTPLSLAAIAGDADRVGQLLADPRTDPNLVDRDRQTPLHWAALAGHLDVVEALLADPRTNPGITDRPEGRTAAEAAEAADHRRVAAVLAERMRRDPGTDELSAADDWEEPDEPLPPFSHGPIVPEPPPRSR